MFCMLLGGSRRYCLVSVVVGIYAFKHEAFLYLVHAVFGPRNFAQISVVDYLFFFFANPGTMMKKKMRS
jgi:hypothetical protein